MALIQVARVPMAGPDDVSGLRALLDEGALRAEDVIAVLD